CSERTWTSIILCRRTLVTAVATFSSPRSNSSSHYVCRPSSSWRVSARARPRRPARATRGQWSRFWSAPTRERAMLRHHAVGEARILHSAIVDTHFGENVKIVQPVNLYGCTIGDDCFVGPFVEIQHGVVVGKRCKIQSHAFICELVTIGDDCVISHGAMFINDPFTNGRPAGGQRELWRPTVVGNHVNIGTNATLLPISICDHVVIGAGAVVTRDIKEPGVYAGNPARLLRRLSPMDAG